MIFTFLSFIFYVILGFWIFGLVARLLLRFWIMRKQREMEQNGGQGGQGTFRGGFYSFGGFGGERGGDARSATKRPEGEVTVEKTAEKSAPVAKQVGDYVDFEEEA